LDFTIPNPALQIPDKGQRTSPEQVAASEPRLSSFSPHFVRTRLEPSSNGVQRKTDQIRLAWSVGDRVGALRIAARFFDRSADTRTFKRGMDAYNNPGFYRQLGKDPEQLTAAALELLARKFALPFSEEAA
jgi:hypothetical protein